MITKTALALTAVITASASFAGGLSPVIVDEVPVVDEGPASSVSPLLILGLLVLIGVLISRNNDDEDETPPQDQATG